MDRPEEAELQMIDREERSLSHLSNHKVNQSHKDLTQDHHPQKEDQIHKALLDPLLKAPEDLGLK